MQKDTLILLCCPDIDRLVTRRCLGSVKATNLERAELHIVDNGYDPDFSHPRVMEKFLRLAEQRGMNLVFLDDDVEIYRYDWLDRLYEVSQDLDADIVSCIHSSSNGRINHVGQTLNANGTVAGVFDFRHDPEWVIGQAVYAPVLCSAIMLVRHPERYKMDAGYKKYHQDSDICMQAWDQGQRVALALDMNLVHNRGTLGDHHPSFLEYLEADKCYFVKKWQDKLETIRQLPEIRPYHTGETRTWQKLSVEAGENRLVNPEKARHQYEEIVQHCYIPYLVAGAYYHLYALTQDVAHLHACNRVNPCHKAARKKLLALGETPSFRCGYTNDCWVCEMKRFGYVTNEINAILNGAFRNV